MKERLPIITLEKLKRAYQNTEDDVARRRIEALILYKQNKLPKDSYHSVTVSSFGKKFRDNQIFSSCKRKKYASLSKAKSCLEREKDPAKQKLLKVIIAYIEGNNELVIQLGYKLRAIRNHTKTFIEKGYTLDSYRTERLRGISFADLTKAYAAAKDEEVSKTLVGLGCSLYGCTSTRG